MSELCLRNRQRARPVDMRLLRRVTRALLIDLLGLPQFALGVHLVDTPEITTLNQSFLHHEGPTDVISFSHAEDPSELYGEVFICVAVAITQARQWRATWQSELVRYLIHGVLHLRGYDDLAPAARRKMKQEEQRLLMLLERRFPLVNLEHVAVSE